MPVQLASMLVPKNGNTFFIVEDTYLKGGFRTCLDVAARDALFASTLKAGMFVYTVAEKKYWRYTSEAIWEELPVGEIGPVGPTGQSGKAGAAGASGKIGPVGPTGLSGIVGADGPIGPTGPTGQDNLGPNPSILMVYKGSIESSIGTLRYFPRTHVTVSKIAAWMSSGTSNATANILKNGIVVATITAFSSTKINSIQCSIDLLPTDYITCDVISGVGLDLTIRLDV